MPGVTASTLMSGFMSGLMSRDGAHGAHELSFAGNHITDAGDALELEDASLHAVEGDIHHELVAGLHGPLEARTINACEVVHGFVVRRDAQGVERQQGSGLRHRFEHQHAGHHGVMREMAHEKGFVDRDVLERLDAFALFNFQHAVHQQDGIAVWQGLEDLVNVHHDSSGLFWWRERVFSAFFRRSRNTCNCLRDAAFFSHDTLSSMGKRPVYLPGFSIERVTTDAAEMCTWSASTRWPSTTAPPPTVQGAP